MAQKPKDDIRRIFKQKEIDDAFGDILKAVLPYGVSKDALDKLKFESEEEKDTFVAAHQPDRSLARVILQSRKLIPFTTNRKRCRECG